MSLTIAERAIRAEELDGREGFHSVWGLTPFGLEICRFLGSLLIVPILAWASFQFPIDMRHSGLMAHILVSLGFAGVAAMSFRRALDFLPPPSRARALAAAAWGAGAVLVGAAVAVLYVAWGAPASPAGLWSAATGERVHTGAPAWSGPATFFLVLAPSAFAIEVALRGMVMGGSERRGEPIWRGVLTALGFTALAVLAQLIGALFDGATNPSTPQRPLLEVIAAPLAAGLGLSLLRAYSKSLIACVIVALCWTGFGAAAVETRAALGLDSPLAAVSRAVFGLGSSGEDPVAAPEGSDEGWIVRDPYGAPSLYEAPPSFDAVAARRLLEGQGSALDVMIVVDAAETPQGPEFWANEAKAVETGGRISDEAQAAVRQWLALSEAQAGAP